METIITIILLMVGSAVANWLQRKANKDQAEEWQDLEDVIGRREKTPPSPPPVPVPRPPPIFKIPERRGHAPHPSPAKPERPQPSSSHRAPPPPAPPVLVFEEEGQGGGGAPILIEAVRKAREAHERASRIHEQVVAKFNSSAQERQRQTERQARRRKPAKSTQMLPMLRDRESLQRAFLASVILGPPKSLES